MYDDILHVKVNHLDEGLIFLTDGLFTPPNRRVFPFSDESDRLMDALERGKWQSWATVVIDPATGCGHSALRTTASHRIGLDKSVRAIAFANVNAILNQRPFSSLLVDDIEHGMPLFESCGERVLFLINMPFSLEPVANTLVSTAAGGEDGCEKTFLALKAIKRYRSQVPRVDVRALVLSYSIGNQDADNWVVLEKARELFGGCVVRWQTLKNERMWRIDGKKEQLNPMPLSSLRLKADCKYYIRDPRKREILRNGYIRKERELRGRGFDALAYGVLYIEAG